MAYLPNDIRRFLRKVKNILGGQQTAVETEAERLDQHAGKIVSGHEEVLELDLLWQDEDHLLKTTCWLMPEDQQVVQPRAVVVGKPLEVQIVAPPRSPLGVDVRIFTYGRENNSALSITLEAADGQIIHQRTLATSGLRDGASVRLLDLGDLGLSPGTPLSLKISSEADNDSCIALPVASVPVGRHSTRTTIVDYRQDRCFAPGSTRDFRGRVALVVSSAEGRGDAFFETIGGMFEGMFVSLVSMVDVEEEWQTLTESDLVAFVACDLNGCAAPQFEAICFALHRRGITTVFIDTTYEKRRGLQMGASFSRLLGSLERQARCCHFLCRPTRGKAEISDSISDERLTRPYPFSSSDVQHLISKSRRRRHSVDLVLVAPQEINFNLDLSALQLVAGQTLSVFPVACQVHLSTGRRQIDVDVRPASSTISDAVHAGHGEIVMIIESDGDGLCADLAEHLFEHVFDDVDVVVSRSSFGAAEPIIEGGLNRVSLKRSTTLSALDEALAFLPTAHLGWSSARAGLELGLSVYRKAGVVRQTQNIRPELPGTGLRFKEVLSAAIADGDNETALLLRRLANIETETVAAPSISRRLPIRILSYRWHAPHQYELHRLPAEFTMVSDSNGMAGFEQWPYNQRPKRPNVKILPWNEVRPAEYDLALLHFDENLLIPFLSNDNLPPGWGESARRLAETGLPTIGLCHGTVPFIGQYGVAEGPINQFEEIEAARQQLVYWFDTLGAPVVCNSFQSQMEWGFNRSRVFWHGLDPLEYPNATHTKDVLVVGGKDRPHYRGYYEEEAVRAHLLNSVRVERLPSSVVPLERENGNAFAIRKFRAYVDEVRQFSFYLNTTLRSPMPRSRGEAMMTGVIPICIRNHDVDKFIDQGVDGFYADDPKVLAAFLNELHGDRDRLTRMSRAARLKAFDVFNHDRNLKGWIALLDEVLS